MSRAARNRYKKIKIPWEFLVLQGKAVIGKNGKPRMKTVWDEHFSLDGIADYLSSPKRGSLKTADVFHYGNSSWSAWIKDQDEWKQVYVTSNKKIYINGKLAISL